MIFTAPSFLFLFLPVLLILYFITNQRWRNLLLLAASLIFYAYGQVTAIPLIGLLVLVNYFLGKKIESDREKPGAGQRQMLLGIVINLTVLIYYKLFANGAGSLWLQNMRAALNLAQFNPVNLPLGLSYICFQLIAYLIDVQEETCDSEKNLFDFALYIFLFPKIIVGPITNYRDLVEQLKTRELNSAAVANGLRRFIFGFAKKALIADQLARIVTPVFSQKSPDFSAGILWLALISYAIQLYFDFSGFSDMAIGLGQILGFRFVENFNYPYIARNLTDFWRRWHISLLNWFREYVFLRLEFTRRRSRFLRSQTNILFVFLLTGLWHGFTPNFLIWGAIHGIAVGIEMTPFGRWLKTTWAPVQHFYTLSVVLLGWLFFSSPTPEFALLYLARLFGFSKNTNLLPFSTTRPLPFLETSVILALLFGILFSLPVNRMIQALKGQLAERFPPYGLAMSVGLDLLAAGLLVVSVASFASISQTFTIYAGF